MLQMVFGEHVRYGTLRTAVSFFLHVGDPFCYSLIHDNLCNVTSGQNRQEHGIPPRYVALVRAAAWSCNIVWRCLEHGSLLQEQQVHSDHLYYTYIIHIYIYIWIDR